jgi:anti-anti-sigma factor
MQAQRQETSRLLQVAVTFGAEEMWIHLQGEVDLSNREQLRKALDAADLDDTAVLHVDLHRLTFCDTGGCRLLVAFGRRARRAGRTVQVHGATPTIGKVMQLLGADEDADA